MGIFANTAVRESYGYAPNELNDVTLRQFDANESVMESCLVGLMESECEWRDMIAGMAAQEYSVLESTGSEMVYEAVDVKGFFAKVVEWFKKLWAKIAGLFQKFLTAISGKISNDAKFIEKYEKKIKAGYNNMPSGGFAFKGHMFENLDSIDYSVVYTSEQAQKIVEGAKDVAELAKTKADKKDVEKYKKALQKYSDNKAKVGDSIRGIALYSKVKSIAAGEFSKTAKEYLLGKEFTQYKGSKEMGLSDIIDEIKTGKYTKEQCKINYNTLKNDINKTIAEINNLSKNSIGMDNDDELKSLKMRGCSYVCDMWRTAGAIYQQLNGIQLSCMDTRHSQARSLAMKLVGYSKIDESASFDTEDMEDLFALN